MGSYVVFPSWKGLTPLCARKVHIRPKGGINLVQPAIKCLPADSALNMLL